MALDLVQGWATAGSTSGSLTVTVNYPVTTTMGNLLIVVVAHNQPLASVEGNGGTAYTLQHTVSSLHSISVYTKVATNNETSVTATLSTVGVVNIALAEYSTLDASSTVETSFTSTSTNQISTTTDAVGAGSVSFACVSCGDPLTDWTNSFVEQVDFGSRGVRLAVATRDNTSAGTFAYTADLGTSPEDVAALTITFGAFAGAATVTPATVPARGGVATPAIDVPVNATVTPAAVAATASVGASPPQTEGQTVVAPVTVAAVAGVMTVVGVDIDSAITPDVVAATASQPLPAGTGAGETLTSVPGPTVAATAAVPTPTVSLGTSVTVTPDTVAASVAFATPTIAAGTAATVSVETVAVVTSTGTPTASSNSVVVPQTVVAATAIFGEPTVAQGVSVYIFRTPTVDEAPLADRNPMFLRMTLARGVTVLRTGDTFTEVRNPTQDELDAADYVYLGGYENRVSGEEATALEAAGYTLEDVE